MKTSLAWNPGIMPPDKGLIVWVRAESTMRGWATLSEGVTREEIEEDFTAAYDCGTYFEPIVCQATIQRAGKNVDQWKFTVKKSQDRP
ncbi:MAG: hypothetical protein JO170_08760 [Verrucomicrobia bacterium]|nr:hypothetical protein [Verrucomicrobiota bacterium]